jgi:hypothetical protein
MSVVLSLYKAIPAEVTYVPCGFDRLSLSEVGARGKLEDGWDDTEPSKIVDGVYRDDFFDSRCSDGEYHECIDITYLRSLSRISRRDRRAWRRNFLRLQSFGHRQSILRNGLTRHIILVKPIVSLGCWCLKPKFFSKANTTVFCTTKKQMLSFFDRYGKGERASDLGRYFSGLWDDGMLFECSY